MQKVMQFPSTDTWLPSAHFPHHFLYLAITFQQGCFGPDLLIVRLSAQAYKLTCFGETQARYLPLLDDSPEGFFGSLTPYSFRITSSIASNSWAF